MRRYSFPDTRRMNMQAEQIFQAAGSTATWRRFASAESGNAVAGLGSAVYYHEQTITAHFGMFFMPSFTEAPRAPGLIAHGQTNLVTREKIGRMDEILWRGATYRADSDPVPSTMPGWWVTNIKRGSE